jgi:hypothetical protein
MAEQRPGGKFEIPDPYVGRVYGNILDQYDNPTYVLTISVPPPPDSTAAPESSTTPAADPPADGATGGTDARSDAPAAGTTRTTPINKKKVVIAQTGVTATQIDDLEITSLPITNATTAMGEIKFTISQPGGANLLDQIQYARKYMGYTDEQLAAGSTSMVLILEIEFKGYTSSYEDPEEGGKPTSIAGPYALELTVNTIAVRIDQTGSYYDFVCVLTKDVGLADHYFKLPTSITSRGKNITEHVESFVTAFNEYLTNNSTDYERPDQIEIDLSELIGRKSTSPGTGGAATSLTINDETVTTTETPGAENAGRPMNNESTAETAEQRQQQLEASPTDSGNTDRVAADGKNNIDVKDGTSVHDYIGILLSMNAEFLTKMTRKADVNDPQSDEVNSEQTFVTWYGVRSTVKYEKWDSRRRSYTKKITYTPYLYETARGDIVLTLNEYKHLEKARGDDGVRIATKRLQDIVSQGNLRKSYYYLFTGKNDQILNLDITYDHAHQLVLPPKGGFTSDISITSAQNLAVQIPENKDMSLRDVFGKAKSLADGNLFKKALSQLSQTANSLSDFATSIGRSVDELSAAINDSTGRAAQALVSALDSATLGQAARALDAPFQSGDLSDTPTENGSITSQGFGPYVPEVSGQIYAADFVTPNDALSIEDLEAAGYIQTDPSVSGQNTSPVVNADLPNRFNNAIYNTSTPANMLFGFVYRQHYNVNFLHKIEMTVRGDPWYIGGDPNTGRADMFNRTNSSEESMALRANQNFMILQIGSPTAYDYRVDDEDANSGYWPNNISNSLSGVYVMNKVVNRFARGIFTTEIEAFREQAIPLHLIRPLRPGEEQTVDFSDVDDSAAAGIFGTLTPGGGGTPDGGAPGGTITPGAGGFAAPIQFNGDINRILNTIKGKESSGDYGILQQVNNSGTASGAYQFTNGTWQNLTRQYGIGTQYATARSAPPEVQDRVAAAYVSEILRNANGDVTKVPLVWYTGNYNGTMTQAQLDANRGLTSQRYQADWLRRYLGR